MFRYGGSRKAAHTVMGRPNSPLGGWRAAALAAALGLSGVGSASGQTAIPGPSLIAPGGAYPGAPSGLMPVAGQQPQMFPAVLTPQAGPAIGDVIAVQPVQHSSRREPNPALDHRIEKLPDQYKDFEVIHNRSQLVVTRKNVRRFHTTNPSVIEIVQYSPTEFSIIGLARGTTDLMLWFEGEDDPLMYLVTVVPDPSLEERRRIDYGRIERKLALLYPNSKVYLIPMSRKVIVRGQAKDSEEASRIMNIVRGEIYTQDGAIFGGYTNGVGGYGNGLNEANAAGAGFGGVGGGGGNNIGGGFGGDLLSSNIINELVVPGEYQVMIRVQIAELNRSMLREWGVNWNSLIEINGDQFQIGTNVGGGNVISLTGVFENFTINTLIRALASNGTVKILEDAAMVTLAGRPAAFLSGGEFAVPTTVGLNGVGVATTTFRGFGTSIIATPTIVDKDLIRLNIVPELSQTNGLSSGGIPGLDVKRVQTQVELREGQTIVLGGLYERQTATEQTRVPLLGEIPVIGSWLFHSKRSTEDEKELLIVVTPEIVRPADADQKPPMPGWYVTHPDDIDFYHLNRTEGNPDLGHYQLLPYGNGQGYAQDVGYNFYNPAPSGGPAPSPTGGQFGGGSYGATTMPGGYSAGYGGSYGTPIPQGAYPSLQPQSAAPLMPPTQYAPAPGGYQGPQPTPISPTAYGRGAAPSGIQQTGGTTIQRPAWGRR